MTPGLACPCRKLPGLVARRELADHIATKHGANRVRALRLAVLIEDRVELSPADLAALEAPMPSASVRREPERVLPNDAALDRVSATVPGRAASAGTKQRTCARPACGKTFQVRSMAPTQKYCGRACYAIAQREARQPAPGPTSPPPVAASALIRAVKALTPTEPARILADAGVEPPAPPVSLQKKAKVADPASCRLCARFAPDKCYRHGGPVRTTSFRGRAIAVRVEALLAAIAKGKQAERELAEVRAALARTGA